VSEVLQQVHSQFVSHPEAEENLCCFNRLDVKVSKLYQDWDRLGSLRGYDHDNSFTSLVRDVTTKKQEFVSDEMKDEVVPPELMSLMGAYKDIFIRVNAVCYSSITLKLKELIPDDSVQNAEGKGALLKYHTERISKRAPSEEGTALASVCGVHTINGGAPI